MSFPNRRNPLPLLQLLTLAVVAATSTAVPRPTLAEDGLVLRKLATETLQKAARAREAKLREIIARQKGDQLKVYLKGSRSIYLNGKSVSIGDLATVFRETGLNKVALTAHQSVHPTRIAEIAKQLGDRGAKDVVQPQSRLTIQELATTKQIQSVRNRETTLREVISRQKSDQLKVYLRDARGIFVNGKSISLSALATIVRTLKPDDAIISFEARVPSDRVNEIKRLLQKKGIKAVRTDALK